MTIQLRVPDASCGHCKTTIEQAVSQVEGVETAELDLDSKVLRVRGDQVDGRIVTKAVEGAGYTAEVA